MHAFAYTHKYMQICMFFLLSYGCLNFIDVI